MLVKSIIIGLLNLLFFLSPFQVTSQSQIRIASNQGSEMWLYTPSGYPGSSNYPLLVSLLGGAEIGTNFERILEANYPNRGPAWFIANNQWPQERPFIVITPKLERDNTIPNVNDQEWDVNVLDEIIEYVCSEYRVDRSRVYLTGISLGAAGCWSYAGSFPSKVAGIVPYAGKADFALACQIKDIPVWAFHGANDGLVRPNIESSIGMVKAISECNGFYKPQLNLLHSKGHEGWNQLYSGTLGYDIYSWLLQFRKGEFVNSPPYVSAGRNLKVQNNADPIYLSAFAFDAESEIEEFLWQQISGPLLTTDLVDSTFLKITNLATGIYDFQLTARDEENEVTRKVVTLEVVDSLTTVSPKVTEFILRNGKDKVDLRPLMKEDFVNLYTEGLTSINIRAVATADTRSLRFIVNNDLDTRTTDQPNPFYIYRPLTNLNEWSVTAGRYTICGIPYPNLAAGGLIGIMHCCHLDVYNQPQLTYFAKPNSDISDLNSWSLSSDGSGLAPKSFIENFQTFIVETEVTVDSTLPIQGVMTTLVVKDGGKLIINDSISIAVSVEARGWVEVNTPHRIKWGSVDVDSDIKFNTFANFIAGASYGNVQITGSGSTKVLDSTLITIQGNLRIDDSIILQGATGGGSTLRLRNMVDIGNIDFLDSAYWFKIVLDAEDTQTISFDGSTLSLKQLTVSSGTNANFSGDFNLQIASKDEGLILENGSSLGLGTNTLKVIDGSTINSNQETGILKFTGGTLIFDTETENASYVRFSDEGNTLNRLLVNIAGGGSLTILDSLVIMDSVSISRGSVFSNGNLILSSTHSKTAFIGPIGGEGHLVGNIQIQRNIGSGRQYRYLSVPLYNVQVSDIQLCLPVTGNFTGASLSNGLSSNPSLFYYDELDVGWSIFPHSSNEEVFTVGRGYALFMRNETAPILLKLNGTIHEGDFEFQLISSTDNLDDQVGWNLIGNPYPAPINWGGPGWLASGVNSTAYIRDNSFPGGRFLTWDGEIGDPEFDGTIAQGQAFWVRSTETEPILIVNENAKQNRGTKELFRVSDNFDFNSNSEVLVVSLIKEELIDRVYVKFNDNGSSSFDRERDGLKKMNGFFNIFSISTDSISIAIKNLPRKICDMLLPLGINGLTVGKYQLDFSTINFDILRYKNIRLKDNYLDSLVSLELTDSYIFYVTEDLASLKRNRFELVSINSMTLPQIFQVEGKLISSSLTGNQWYLNGEIISGATKSIFRPSESGNYSVKVTYLDCMAFSESVTYIITESNDPVGICQIFPNPTKGTISILCPSWHNQQVNIDVRNTLGKVVKSTTLTFEAGVINISIEDEPPGLYLLKIGSKADCSYIKFIKE